MLDLATGVPGLEIGEALSPTGRRSIENIFGFRSNADTLIVRDSSVLDFETLPEYRFTIVATDSASASATANVTITLLDFNDNAPVIFSDRYIILWHCYNLENSMLTFCIKS